MSQLSYANPRSARINAGLTLLELIVALAILAALSTMALRAVEPLADQSRYELTQTMLDQLRDATVGDWGSRGVGNGLFVAGYIADTGVLPTALVDLSVKPVGLIDSTVQSFDSNRDAVNDVTLSSGWSGPYLVLGVGQTEPLDGWGRAPLVDPDGGTFDFQSLGSDGDSLVPEEGYRADISVPIPLSSYTSSLITFRLFSIDGVTGTRVDPTVTGTEQLGVILYRVNGNGGATGAIEETTLPVASTGTFEASQANFIHGKAAARGFLWDDANANLELDSGEAIILSSYVHYFTVVGGNDGRIEMELR